MTVCLLRWNSANSVARPAIVAPTGVATNARMDLPIPAKATPNSLMAFGLFASESSEVPKFASCILTRPIIGTMLSIALA